MNFKGFLATRAKSNNSQAQKPSKDTTSHSNFDPQSFIISDQNISYVFNNVPHEYLKETVCRYFLTILENSPISDYHYFTMYPEWQNLFWQNDDIAFSRLMSLEDFKMLINIFPEHEIDIYNELLNRCIFGEFSYYERGNISLPNDILIPLAYLEKYCNAPALNVRKCVKSILCATNTFKEFYETIYVFENYFNISYSDMKQFIDDILKEEVDMWINKTRDIDDVAILDEFFEAKEAYGLFMESIYQILHSQGIELYAYLLRNVGPVKELIQNECACFEYEQ